MCGGGGQLSRAIFEVEVGNETKSSWFSRQSSDTVYGIKLNVWINCCISKEIINVSKVFRWLIVFIFFFSGQTLGGRARCHWCHGCVLPCDQGKLPGYTKIEKGSGRKSFGVIFKWDNWVKKIIKTGKNTKFVNFNKTFLVSLTSLSLQYILIFRGCFF